MLVIGCDICGKIISKPGKRVFYNYRDTEGGRQFICNDCAYNFFDDRHVYIRTAIAEALNENIEVSVRERVQQRSHTTD